MGNLFCYPKTTTRCKSIDELTKIHFAINTCIALKGIEHANALLDRFDEEDRKEILKTFDRRQWNHIRAE